MTPRDILRFQFGFADAIRTAAASRAALPTAVVLVLLTAVPRSYDQTWIGEKPILWLFGPLLFSLVSGTWFFIVIYTGFIRARWNEEDRLRSAWRDWPSFMGVYWMTAPCAWLYALPVERFFDEVNAAKANVALLVLVSVWRVGLFSRIVQVLTGARYLVALVWVLVAACIEAFLILFFTRLAEAVARGMGGLRHSPAEEVILGAVGFASVASVVVGLPAILVGFLWNPNTPLLRLKSCDPGRVPGGFLGVLAAFWGALAFWAQPTVHRSVEVDQMTRAKDYRGALDLMARYGQGGFAAARSLPPDPTQWLGFEEMAGFIRNVSPSDPEWIRAHLTRRLDELFGSVLRYHKRTANPLLLPEESVSDAFEMASVLSRNFSEFGENLATNAWLAPWRDSRRVWVSGLARRMRNSEIEGWETAASLLQESLRESDSQGTRSAGGESEPPGSPPPP